MESKELLVPNPLLYDGSLCKYIWISDLAEDHRNAQYLFGYLMRRNLYINGFATSSVSMMGLKMYNKKIQDINFLQQENTVIFYDIWRKDIWKIHRERGHKARIINPDICGENIVIWGSGITGENVFRLLAEAKITVRCFVDSNKDLAGTVKCGIPVCSPDVLEEDCTIIEAMEQWRQLDEEIAGRFSKRFHFTFNVVWDQVVCNLDGIEKKVFSLSDFGIFERFMDKRVYIFGTGVMETMFAKCLRLLDYVFAGFLTDDEDEFENGKYRVMRVEDILYEENYYVWTYDMEKSRKLAEIGLRYYVDYECAINAYGIVSDAEFCLDVNLGHTYLVDDSAYPYPGFEIYGRDRKEDYKIAVLGASTTEGVEFPFKSWPQILYEKLGQGNTVYNGGVSGYWLGQQMMKLLRDIIPLKPDILIVYDGYMELCANTGHPLAFPYMMTVSEYGRDYLGADIMGKYGKTVAVGVDSGRDVYENWMYCVRNMHAIAEENNIPFFYFCQPWLASKAGKTIKEKEMLLSAPSGSLAYEKRKAFRQFLNHTILPDYVYDLSYIFDGEANIYMDSCHVWEKGNRIIADVIYEIIYGQLHQKPNKTNSEILGDEENAFSDCNDRIGNF